MHQPVVQVFGVVIVGVYTFVLTFGMLKIINFFEPVRVSREAEILGLDDYIHHEVAYF